MAAPPKRTALYRYLDAEGHPLYIGISNYLENRKKAHAQSRWALEAADFTVEWFDTEKEAAAAETLAIRTERPVYNRADNYQIISLDATEWPSLSDAGRSKALRLADLIRCEIDSGRWPARHKLPAPRDLAAATGIGEGATKHAIEHLIGDGYVYRYRAFGHFVRPRGPRTV